MENKKILVLCTGNSCRSQIAEGYWNFFLKNRANIYSAGVDNHEINSLAIKTMKNDGIDISKQTSNNINEFNLPILVFHSENDKTTDFSKTEIFFNKWLVKQ